MVYVAVIGVVCFSAQLRLRIFIIFLKEGCSMKKRFLGITSSLIMLCILFSVLVPSFNVTAITAETESDDNSLTAHLSLDELMQKFPDGFFWNHVGQEQFDPDHVTKNACAENHSGIATCNWFNGSTQNEGFIKKITYDFYGNDFSTWGYKDSLAELKAGDVIEYSPDGLELSYIWVTSVTDENITYVDCDAHNCEIRWNLVTTKTTISSQNFLRIYVAPEILEKTDNHKPVGTVENVIGGQNKVIVSGWAYDPDSPDTPVQIRIFWGEKEIGTEVANVSRPDLVSAIGNENHGFCTSLSVNDIGTDSISVICQNIDKNGVEIADSYTKIDGSDVQVSILNSSTQNMPQLGTLSVSQLSSKGYRIIGKVSNTSKISTVKFASWTVDGGKDDLKITVGTVDDGYVDCYIKTDDHNNQTGAYITEVYLYDNENNCDIGTIGCIDVSDVPVPRGMVAYNGHTYVLYSSNKKWTDAQSWCTSKGGYLATITNNTELERINGLLSRFNGFPVWLGAEKTSGIWRWIDDSDFIHNQANWNTNQPDNSGGIEYYLGTFNSGKNYACYKWNDFPNDYSIGGFVCEFNSLKCEYLIGDANMDGVVDITDATSIQKVLADYAQDFDPLMSDTDADSRMTITDATTIQKYLADFINQFPDKIEKKSEKTPSVSYQAHVMNIGWQNYVQSQDDSAAVAGTTGEAKRLEGLVISLNDIYGKSMITYRSHVAQIGWQDWKSSGEISGTTGRALAIEAVQIKLEEPYSNYYDIVYRVHVANKGWLGWTKNGETAGSTGLSLQTEAIQIMLVDKYSYPVDSNKAILRKPDFSYQAHSMDKGWLGNVSESQTAGTTGESRRLEALIINLSDFDNGNGVLYNAHLSNVGWQGWRSSGQIAGTTGESRAMEAIQIKLSDTLSPYFDVYYRVHSANIGWLGWAKNGESAGTTGGAIPAEAIQIKIVNKGAAFNTEGAAYRDETKVVQTISGAEAFISDSRWCNGSSWGYYQRPKLSSWGSIGCCAYAADFVKYVYNANSPSSGIAYHGASNIRSGDVLYFTPDHWVVVISRNGNALYTAEGNWNSQVVVSSTAYSVVGNVVYRSGKQFRTFSVGYHYQ